MSKIPKLTPNRECFVNFQVFSGILLTFRYFCAYRRCRGYQYWGAFVFYKNNLDKRLQLDSIDTLRHMAVNFICMVDIPLWPIYMQWNKSTRVCFIGRCISKTVIQWVPRANPIFFWATSPSPFHFCTTSIVLLQNTCIIKYKFCPCHHEVIL